MTVQVPFPFLGYVFRRLLLLLCCTFQNKGTHVCTYITTGVFRHLVHEVECEFIQIDGLVINYFSRCLACHVFCFQVTLVSYLVSVLSYNRNGSGRQQINIVVRNSFVATTSSHDLSKYNQDWSVAGPILVLTIRVQRELN